MIKRVVRDTSLADWEDVARKCSHATFFHTPEWSGILASTFDGVEALTVKFTFDDGKTALLPLVRVKSRVPLFNTYLSGFAGVYGGAISEEELSSDQHRDIFGWANKNMSSFELRINPFDRSMKGVKWGNCRPEFTQVIDLRKGSDSVYSSWSEGNRRAIKQAIRNGIAVKEASTAGEWHDYYDMYLESIARWGKSATNRHPRKMFENMRSGNDGNVKLWLACCDHVPVSGALCFYHNRHVAYWHGAGLKEHFGKRPTQLLFHTIVSHAIDHGYWYFDFHPSGGHESLVEFKNRFGTQKLECGLVYKTNALANLLAAPARSVHRVLTYASSLTARVTSDGGSS